MFSIHEIPGYKGLVANPIGAIVDAALRAVGHVMFENNPPGSLMGNASPYWLSS